MGGANEFGVGAVCEPGAAITLADQVVALGSEWTGQIGSDSFGALTGSAPSALASRPGGVNCYQRVAHTYRGGKGRVDKYATHPPPRPTGAPAPPLRLPSPPTPAPRIAPKSDTADRLQLPT